MRILVTGATGNIGSKVVYRLLERGIRVRALTRQPAAASLPDQVEVMQGDLMQPETLAPCLHDVEQLFLISIPETAAAVVEQAKEAGVRRIVVLSSGQALHEDKSDPNWQHFIIVERAVEASGLAWTFLRPAGYMRNILYSWGDSIRAESVVRAPYGQAAYPYIHEADVADVAALLLAENSHIGKKYLLPGSPPITQIEQAQAISAAIGRPIHFEELTPAQARALWRPYMSEQEIDIELLVFELASRKKISGRRQIVEEITGCPPRTFAQWAVEHAQHFR